MCWYTPIDFKPYTWVIFIKEHIEFQVSERDVRQSLWCFSIQSSSYVVMGNASHPDTLEVTGWDLSPHGSCLGMYWLDSSSKSCPLLLNGISCQFISHPLTLIWAYQMSAGNRCTIVMEDLIWSIPALSFEVWGWLAGIHMTGAEWLVRG